MRLFVDQEFKNRNPVHDGHVTILISEWDTFYGRSLPEAFVGHIKSQRDDNEQEGKFCWNGDKDQNKNPSNTDEGNRSDSDEGNRSDSDEGNRSDSDEGNRSDGDDNGVKCDHDTCQYVYMRGLDGEILDGESSVDTAANKSDSRELERAVGVNRFDYLRRLVHRIKDDFYGRAESVGVVGILGSDVYDKLVVLQALRPSFPDALFFVTDADARYLHPSEFEWTRGLVVMSSYGLKGRQIDLSNEKTIDKPDKRPKLNLPPFRDSYQTSVFLATQRAAWHSLNALGSEYEGDDWCKRHGDCNDLRQELAEDVATPKAFEVGRSMLVPLEEKEQRKFRKQFRPISRGRSILAVVVAGSGFLLLCALLSFQFSRRQVWRFVVMAACVILSPLLLTVVVYYADAFDGEPLPLLGGANMLPLWPFSF